MLAVYAMLFLMKIKKNMSSNSYQIRPMLDDRGLLVDRHFFFLG